MSQIILRCSCCALAKQSEVATRQLENWFVAGKIQSSNKRVDVIPLPSVLSVTSVFDNT
jgi:hypothetical protein